MDKRWPWARILAKVVGGALVLYLCLLTYAYFNPPSLRPLGDYLFKSLEAVEPAVRARREAEARRRRQETPTPSPKATSSPATR